MVILYSGKMVQSNYITQILVPNRHIIKKNENAQWILSPLSFLTSLYSVHRTKHDLAP